jgi:phosphoenolpyruvate carboxykinase (GTP)
MGAREVLQNRLDPGNFDKLMAIDNPEIHEFVAKYVELCNPEKVLVITDSPEDLNFVRQAAVDTGEEKKLAIEGHTIHFDGYYDQARDKGHTKFLVPKGVDLGPNINAINKDEGVAEVHEILKDIMVGHTMYVRFFALGPTNSVFTIPSLQLTDSAYVAHSLDLLYRQGYEEFKRLGRDARFFRVVHSQGELAESNTSKNIDKRRIYIDTQDNIVYSTNTQYGGNTLGLKKLSMRLAINRASAEGWLCEHMFLMGINGPGGRVSYFTGAFPSLCGKTSTSMMTGESIVGDDIAYLRTINGEVRAVNVEKGMFGIIMGINSKDDPLIWKTLHSPGELIASNILKDEDGNVYWIDMGTEIPEKGFNHSGEWFKGKVDEKGNEITPSHKNARFTVSLDRLENVDPKLHDPDGCMVSGIIYGGRDSDTWVPIRESFNWTHGIIAVASSLESETTAATLGQEGVRKFNLMSNMDFVSIPLGKYIQANLDFGAKANKLPHIYGVNYFLKDKESGEFLNAKTDKGIWLKWAELRAHGEVDAIETPTGLIPKYEDLKRLFKEVQNKDYSHEDYVKQFTLRIPENLAKIERIKKIYEEKVPDSPEILFKVLDEEKKRLEDTRAKLGDYVEPEKFAALVS